MILYLLITLLCCFIVKGMAETRGRSVLAWVLATLLISPLVTIPLLLFLGKSKDMSHEDYMEAKSANKAPGSNSGRAMDKIAFIAAGLVLVWLMSEYITVRDVTDGLVKDILKEHDEQMQVHSISIPYQATFLDSEGKALVSKGDEENSTLVRFNITHIDNSIYLEIPATETMKLR